MSEPNVEQRVFAHRIAEDGGWHTPAELASIIADRDSAMLRRVARAVASCADREDQDGLVEQLERGEWP